jgi:Tol biopolymer transport system component/predicted Ser/Thr protein kinase
LPSAPDLIGTSLRHYRIVSLLGEGGMGVVYKAYDPTLERHVALKILPPELLKDADRRERFVQEAKAASALQHPHVVAIHEIGREGDVHFITMELVEGKTLREALRTRELDLKKAFKLLEQVAEALSAAHTAGIVHRDLKPENIMIAAGGYAKVLDFGLAKLRARESSASDPGTSTAPTATRGTDPGTVLGTAGYMSPEQAQGKPVDHRSDIFSLGCILYEAATGVRPFRGESSIDTLHRIIYSEPEAIAKAAPGAPLQLQWILRKALAKDPDDRYQSARDLAIDLKDVIREMDSDPRMASAAAAASVPRGSRKWALLAIGAGVMVAVAAAVLTYRADRRLPATAAPASPLSVTRLTGSGKVIEAAISPDGKYLAYVEADQGQQGLWLRQLSGGRTLELIPARAGVAYWGHTFTTDGSRIVYGMKNLENTDGAFYEIPTLGGTPRKLVTGIDSTPAFSPDGTRMAWLRGRHPGPDQSALMVANSDGSEARILAARRHPEAFIPVFFSGPSWSPDGKRIAATVVTRQAGLRRATVMGFRADTGAEEVIADEGWVFAAQVGWLPSGDGLLAIAQGPHQGSGQVWLLPYPRAPARSLTNDLLDYRIISLTADGRSFLTVAAEVQSQVWTMPLSGDHRPRKVSSARTDGAYGVASAPDGRIVYTSLVSGAVDLWTMAADGTDRRALTNDPDGEIDPHVASGQVFFSTRTAAGGEIRRMRLDGEEVRTVVKGVPPAPISVSDDGRSVVYVAAPQGVPQLWCVRGDGGVPERLTEFESALPAVSHDGSRVAAYLRDPSDGRFRLGLLPITGGAFTTKLEMEPPFAGSALLWAPGDKGLLVNTMPRDRANVWLQPLDGGRATKLTDFDEPTMLDFDVAADGKTLVMARGAFSRDAVLISGFR